jgi:CelD/BcsL family acetyltransferase involved in cellulose biosynthesis
VLLGHSQNGLCLEYQPAMTARSPATLTHPHWIRAISAHLPGAEHVKVPATGLARLEGALVKRSLPVPYYDSWLTPLSNSGLPSAGLPPSVPDALAMLDATESPILFRNLPVDHPVTQALLQAAGHQKVLKCWERAGLHLQGSYEDWLQNNFDHKRRKELKRLRARLSEQGKLESVSLREDADIKPFCDAFLKLEAQSWKGQRGTAIAMVPGAAKALEAGLRVMQDMGRLKFWQINLDGQPIASLFAIVDDGEVGLGKIAHAEAFAKYSPGVMVILDATEDLLKSGQHVRADSNAIPGHPMIDRIWRDRIACMDVLVASPSVPTHVFQFLSFWLGMKDAAKGLIKRILARTTGRKVS